MKLALAAAICLAATISAQQPPFTDPANLRGERVSPRTGRELPIDEGARGLEQMLRKLNTRASLMMIVAHPDDEDGGLLTLYSRGLGARVADLSLTRGEGGQNAMTGDFEDALGLIRTQELLSSDRYTGVDQFFGTEVDFGFSKTKEEAFAKWTHERVLYDAVRAVRLYRPLVIAAVFLGGVTDGHGQHQVAGEIAQEVFKAAGDPKVFPELTAEGILPWQPLKVYARVPTQSITAQGLFDYATGQYAPARFTNYVTGEVTTTAPSVDVTVHEGQTDPLLSGPGEPARSYVQFARIGLGLQKTQIGPGVRLAVAGAYDIGYHRYGSRLSPDQQKQNEDSFFDGIDTSIESIGEAYPSVVPTDMLSNVSRAIHTATGQFDPAHPSATAPLLAIAAKDVKELITAVADSPKDPLQKANALHELRTKQVQLNDALALALGLGMQSQAPANDLLAGSDLGVPIRLGITTPLPRDDTAGLVAGNAGIQTANSGTGGGEPKKLSIDSPYSVTFTLQSPQTSTITQPYFFRTNIEQPVYTLRDPALRNAPATPPALTSWAHVRYHDVQIQIGRVVTHTEQPVSFVPPYSLTLNAHAQVIPVPERSVQLIPMLRATTGVAPAQELPVSVRGQGVAARSVETPIPGQARLDVTLPADARTVTLAAEVTTSPHAIYEGLHAVGYPGIPLTNYYTPATDRIVSVALKLPAKRRIAYLPGTGDPVPEALASIGLPVSILAISDLTPEHLSQFSTVVLGVRTYNAHPDLHGAPTQALLDFARNGGNVVVQYQTPEFTADDAPYPLSIGNAEKVVDETTPVDLLQPTAAVFSAPNRITSADFNNWIEERGHDFLQSWDPRYTALTETHDPGQAPQEGGLITTQLGRGHWTYCAFALYRQLPEAVPGAFRVFVNLLGLADER